MGSESKQVLLIAPSLLGEALSLQIGLSDPEIKVCTRSQELSRHPSLVIWSLESVELPYVIQIELRRLVEAWSPSPVLVILPQKININRNEILQFECPGLLQDPDLETLTETIRTLIGGGRVIRLKDLRTKSNTIQRSTVMGLSEWLLVSGIQQINRDLEILENSSTKEPENSLAGIIINGRKRELIAAKSLLFFIWGSKKLSLNKYQMDDDKLLKKKIGLELQKDQINTNAQGTNINLKERNSLAVWDAIRERLDNAIRNGLDNSTGELLAIEGLNSTRQSDLLLSTINQLDQVIKRLRSSSKDPACCEESWFALQSELRQQALRSTVGNYLRLESGNQKILVIEELLKKSDLINTDEELPNPNTILDPLIFDKPIYIEGQLLPSDDPRAIIYLEGIMSNWLIRTAEIISAEILSECAEWPELRRYLLKPDLISTRELERLRNQLNSQNRWKNLVQRPIQLYESKRLLYRLENGSVETILITEPRDEELRKLGWLQQQVALLVEARDALAPQLQALVKRLGDLMVILLTQVVGRSIGLVGRGIAQGMGRSFGRS